MEQPIVYEMSGNTYLSTPTELVGATVILSNAMMCSRPVTKDDIKKYIIKAEMGELVPITITKPENIKTFPLDDMQKAIWVQAQSIWTIAQNKVMAKLTGDYFSQLFQ